MGWRNKNLSSESNPYEHILNGDYVPSASRIATLTAENLIKIKTGRVFSGITYKTSERIDWKELSQQKIELTPLPQDPPQPIDIAQSVKDKEASVKNTILELLECEPDTIVMECGRHWASELTDLVSQLIQEATGTEVTPTTEGRMKRLHLYRWDLRTS